MLKKLLLGLLTFLSLNAFESTNIQFLYSDKFNGDAFIYDSKNGKKSTLTFEHFRTFSYGDLFIFTDMMDGQKFNNKTSEVYTEIGPRFSLSKVLDRVMCQPYIIHII
jgi:nucleoside-specific outer membrane channel protein Tsx